MKNKNALNKFLTGLYVATMVCFIISFSIFVIITSRVFYYSQIDLLHMVDETADFVDFEVTKQTIIDAFNAVQDFIWKFKPFTVNPEGGYFTGALPLSEEGMQHFKDCVPIFWAFAIFFVISAINLFVLIALWIFDKFKPVKIFKMNPLFLSGLIIITLFGALTIVIFSVDFNDAFVVFHKLFFPGKSNWLFNPYEDVVISALPEQFFMNCTIVICSFIIGGALACIIYSIIEKVKEKKLIK